MAAHTYPDLDDALHSLFLQLGFRPTTDTSRHYLQTSDWDHEHVQQRSLVAAQGWWPTRRLNGNLLDYQHLPYSGMVEDEDEDIRGTGVWEKVAGSDRIDGGENSGSGVVVVDDNSGERLGDKKVDSGEEFEAPDDGDDGYDDDNDDIDVAYDDDDHHHRTPLNDLASLFCPPLNLMFPGDFEQAKDAGKEKNRWLLVNVQSDKEFNCHMLNRDTWANETVVEIVGANFVFWLVQHDTEWGNTVCNYYSIDSFPLIMVIDPFTGQKMASWTGMIQPETLQDKLDPFMDGSPRDRLFSLAHRQPSGEAPQAHEPQHDKDDKNLERRALAFSMEDLDIGEVGSQESEEANKITAYPPLPEEPKGDGSLLCRVGIRLPPDGRRIQRNFLLTDPIQLLWSFCFSELDEEARARPFRLTQSTPRGFKCLEYHTNAAFKDSGLANSMLSVILD